MEGDVLVLRLRTFSGSVAAAVEQAIGEATAGNTPKAVVLDMRGNPGGLLREAVTIADAFLSSGDIVTLRGRTASNQRMWKADAAELLAGLPMLVLIDARSASAAELVAAALQENGRAKVMGQRSYGKGTVQSTYSLGDQQGALKLTTAFYLGPSGRSVQRVGVAPDIEIVTPASTQEVRRAPAPAQVPAGVVLSDANKPQTPAARVAQERCALQPKVADPVLSCAMAYLHAPDFEAFVREFAGASLPAR